MDERMDGRGRGRAALICYVFACFEQLDGRGRATCNLYLHVSSSEWFGRYLGRRREESVG